MPVFSPANADTRIDENTPTNRDRQVAALQKGPDGIIQQAGVASCMAGIGAAGRLPAV